jgi:hypothetical protein
MFKYLSLAVLFNTYINADAAPSKALYFQEESTINMLGIRDLHDHLMFYLILVLILVSYFLIVNILQINIPLKINVFVHDSFIEVI